MSISYSGNPLECIISWQEIRPSSTTTSSVKSFWEFRDGVKTGRWKEVYPASDAASNEVTIIYHPNKNSNATCGY